MRVAGETAAVAELAPKIGQLSRRQAAFQKCSRVDTRRGVRLKMHLVPAVAFRAGPEQMVETYLHHGRSGKIGGDMPAYPGTRVISLQHHSHGIPADDVANPSLQLNVARIRRLLAQIDGVLVRGVERRLGQHQAAMG